VSGNIFQACIVVHSDSLTGLELTSRLDMTPTEYTDLGTMDEQARVREFTTWTLISPLEDDAPVDEHLTWLLDTVAPANNRLRGLIATELASVRIEAFVGHAGPYRMTFLNDVLTKLGDFPGHFWLTAYTGLPEE
jgi:hypothetical protein